MKDKKDITNFILRTQEQKKLSAHKSTNLQQRLIAYSQNRPNNANLLWDTAVIKYSGERISYFDNLLMFYDLTYPEYNSSFDFYFLLPIGLLENGDIWADSTKRWRRHHQTQVMDLYDETIKQFDNDDKLLSVNMHQHYAGDHEHYQHVYDTQGRIIRTYKTDITNGDSLGIYYFEYDNAGNMVRDSNARHNNNQWIAGRSTFYTYNQNGDISEIDILSSQLDSQYHVTIIYDNLDRLFHIEIKYNYGLYWEGQYQEFFSYPGNDPEFQTRQSMQWSVGNWHFYDRYVKESINNVTDTLEYFLYEDGFSWVRQYQTGFVYNAFGNVEQATMRFFDLNEDEIPDMHSVYTYYYEQFFPAGVEQANHSTEAISYPNPTGDKLTINLEHTLGAHKVSLYNAQGQVVLNKPCMDKEQAELDLSDLAAGMYYFVVRDKQGLQVRKGKVQKL